MSKLDKKQTVFISYLVNDFLKEHGITEQDIEKLGWLDIHMLLKDADGASLGARFIHENVPDRVFSEEIQKMVQTCIKGMVEEGTIRLSECQKENIDLEKEKRSVTDLANEESLSYEDKDTLKETANRESIEEQDEESITEVNEDLLGLLDSFQF